MQSAIVYLLWNKNNAVLDAYLQQGARQVLTFAAFADAGLRDTCARHGAEVIVLETFLDEAANQAIRRDSQQRLESLVSSLASPSWRELGESMGLDGQRLAAPAARVLQQGLGSVSVLDMLQRAKARHAIGLVVLNEEWNTSARLIQQWAKANAIPTLHVTHGAGLAGYYTVHGVLDADKYAVFGPRAVETLVDAGVARERIEVTGNPSWDGYVLLPLKRNAIRAELAGRHGLPTGAKWVVFATTWAAGFTAYSDPAVYDRTVLAALAAVRQARDKGLDYRLIVKDRPSNRDFGAQRTGELVVRSGFPAEALVYDTAGAEAWITAADVVVSVDSNCSIEAVLAGVPAVNLYEPSGFLLGPSFAAEDGIVEVAPEALGDALERILEDKAERARVLMIQRTRIGHFNGANDGKACLRVARLMAEMERPPQPVFSGTLPRRGYVWEALSNPEEEAVREIYHDIPRKDIIDFMIHPPRRVLDIGCGAGATGKRLKEIYAGIHVIGIELNHQAAAIARDRLDLVLDRPLEEVDLAAHGVPAGSIDTVIVADVLEHIYDPWSALIHLRPWLSPDAQVLASIPNLRNLALIHELAHGRFPYMDAGLTDVTHIRFFTRAEIEKLFRETGYRITRWGRNLVGLADRMNLMPGGTAVDTGKILIKDLSADDFEDLKTLQFLVAAAPVPDLELKLPEPPEPTRRPSFDDLYPRWLASHQYQPRDALWVTERMAAWRAAPGFHFGLILPDLDEAGQMLGDTLRALAQQFNARCWRLSVVADVPAPDGLEELPMVEWLLRPPEQTPLAALSACLAASPMDWVGVIEAGDRLASHALFSIADHILRHPDWRLLYVDEDSLDADGGRTTPYFKPDFSIDLVRAASFALGGPLLWRRDLFAELGGFDPVMDGVEQWDLTLKTFERVGTAGIGHVAEVIYHRHPAGGHCRQPAELVESARVLALAEHLERSGLGAELDEGLLPGTFHVRYRHEGQPLVSILIPSRNQAGLLKRCLDSLARNTAWPNLEIIVIDNGSDQPDALDYLARLRGEGRVRVLPYPQPFNFAAMNNLAAAEAKGDYLLLLNNDVAALQPDWLDEMMALARRPDVGCVGARLVFDDGRIQHAGIVLGMQGAAEHIHSGAEVDSPGYFGRLQLPMNYTAVTAACLLVKKSTYQAVGGMDADNLTVSFNDLDFCLKVRAAGWLNVYTPFATLLHDANVTQLAEVDLKDPVQVADKEARFSAEQDVCMARWRREIAFDPAYNRNLSLAFREPYVEISPSLTLDPDWRPAPRILAHPGDRMGCGEYRIIAPMRQLNAAGRAQGWETGNYLSVPELFRFEPETILVQRQIEANQLDMIERRYMRHSQAFRVFEIDDLITDVPVKSHHYQRFLAKQNVIARFHAGVRQCHRLLVSTEFLAEEYRHLADEVRVFPNYLERAKWGGFKPVRRQGGKPRVGWSGSLGHEGDLEILYDVVAATADEVDWIFYGICPEPLRPYVREYHGFEHIADHPAKLASLNLDLAVAPLDDVPFNHAKSHLKLLEYGVMGYPVICTDITPYRGDYPVTRVASTAQAWLEAIREHVADLDELARRGDALRRHVDENWMLEDHLDVVLAAWLPGDSPWLK